MYPIFSIIGSKICSNPLAYALNVYGIFLRPFKSCMNCIRSVNLVINKEIDKVHLLNTS